jgi:uncharacterized protein YebE (UPF0316 family)
MNSPLGDTLGISPEIFHWLVVPLLIFLARICDVSINTVRVMFVMSGKRKLAPFIGFFESLIWLIAISQILKNMDSWVTYVAYAGGFATGIYVGMRIEERLAVGKVILRIITTSHQAELINIIKNNGFGITIVDAHGARGDVNLIFTVIERKDINRLVQMIQDVNPKAFYTIENVRHASDPLSMDFADDEAQMTQGGWMTRFKGVKK